ncbi:MAG: cell wall-binding repeat-containing protein [Lachnospiraceae bacterium]|nr:cell wall-binding repeat-containing protein [Lachnospiraceae bacterium]
MNKLSKRLISLILTVFMIVALLPTTAFAYYGTGDAVTDYKTVYRVGQKDISDDDVVYISISNDDKYVVSNGTDTGTVMSYVPVKISDLAQVDLAKFGLQDYLVEAPAEQGGGHLVTAMHLFVYTLEQYYQDGWEVTVTGNAGSAYMQNGFWGHDENLTYNVNGEYPLAAEKWGATFDTIVLQKNDYVDITMYSDWDFFNDENAGYHYFLDASGVVTHEYTTVAGTGVNVAYGRAKTDFGGEYTTSMLPCAGEIFVTTAMTEDPRNSEATVMSVNTDATGKAEVMLNEAGTYYLYTYGATGNGEAIVSGPAYAKLVVTAPPRPDEVFADVTVRAQVENAYLYPFTEKLHVSSYTSDIFGYKDSSADVTALDALIAYHKVLFGDDFTKETAETYLVVSSSGWVTKVFGEETSGMSFLINGGAPNDGTESSYGGYNGLLINQATLANDDIVDIFLYAAEGGYADYMTYVSVPEDTIYVDSDIIVKVDGIGVMNGYLYQTPAAMKAAANPLVGAGLAWLDIETGTVTPIKESNLPVRTAANGQAVVKAPDTAGTYYLVAVNGAVEETNVFTVMNPTAVTVALAPEVFADVTVRTQAENVYLMPFDSKLHVSSHAAEEKGYKDVSGSVTAVDVLVAAHSEMFGDEFDTNPKNYLDVSASGWVTKIFGQSADMALYKNGWAPNDGTESSYGGYNGLLVTQITVTDNDVLDVMFYSKDATWTDYYTYITPVTEKVMAGEDVTVKVTGYMACFEGSNYLTPEAAAACNKPVVGAALAFVDPTSGEVGAPIKVNDKVVLTDAKGEATFKMPAEVDDYYLTAISYVSEDEDVDDIAVFMNPVKLEAGEVTDGFNTITINAVPSTVDVTFYSDADASVKVQKSRVKDNGVVDGAHQYVLTVPDGTYSYRAEDGDVDLGGMSFSLPIPENVTTTEDNTVMKLVRVNWYTANKSVANIGDYELTVNAGAEKVTTGGQYKDSSNRIVTPGMVWAYGNAKLYNWSYKLNGELAASYGVVPAVNQTFATTLTATQNKTFSLSALKTFTVVAPADAETKIFYQLNNFNTIELTDVVATPNDDGTVSYVASYPAFANASYRVSKAGCRTEAGYAKDNAIQVVTFDESASPADSTSTFTFGDDRSVFMNVGDSIFTNNELAMSVGETFRLKAYRGWEIVNTVTSNIMIEPDFHVNVLSGADVIDIKPVENAGGNARNNWMDITALKEGTAVVSVSYDAINIGGNTTIGAVFGASDPARNGVFVVNVGSDAKVEVTPVCSDDNWDSEFDTVFFTGDSTTFSFAADATAVSVMNVYGNEMGAAQAGTQADGLWTVPITEGANIITLNSAAGTDYLVVRGKKLAITLTNNTTEQSSTNPAEVEINVGDEISITFNSLVNPIPKMSGIYNPGYMNTVKTTYTLNDAFKLQSKGAQYNYKLEANSSLTFKALVPGENKLSSGYIDETSMGNAIGDHRNISDLGVAANFNASAVPYKSCILPDITFTVKEGETEVDKSEWTKINKVSLYAGPSAYMTGFKFNQTSATAVKDNNATNWTQLTDAMGNYYLGATVTAASYYNTIVMTYWYDGGEKENVELTSGAEAIVKKPLFAADGDKVLNIQITITAGDGSESRTLNYVVYPGKANLQYVHPIIGSLTARSEEDAEAEVVCEMGHAWNYTETDYTMDIGTAQDLTFTAAMVQKYTNATSKTQDNSDAVTLVGIKNGEPVGEPVLVQAGADFPTGSWTYELKDADQLDGIQLTVVSYVREDAARTYNVTFTDSCEADRHDWETELSYDAPPCLENCTKSIRCKNCDIVRHTEPVEELLPHKDDNSDDVCDYCDGLLYAKIKLAGSSRWETAAAIAEAAYPDGADEIIVVTGQKFPDALAANAYAGAKDAPIILTKDSGLPAAIKKLLKTTWGGKVTKATIIGGTITTNVLKDLDDCGVENINMSLTRGTDRYQTAELICTKGLNTGLFSTDTVILTTGKKAADALSVSSWSNTYRLPILLTKGDGSMTKRTQELVGKFENVIVLGGCTTEKKITACGVKASAITMLKGSDRYETSLKIAEFFMNNEAYGNGTLSLENACIARGADANFPDALAGGMLAGLSQTPVILVSNTSDKVYKSLEEACKDGKPTGICLLGAATDDTIVSKVTKATGIKPTVDLKEFNERFIFRDLQE